MKQKRMKYKNILGLSWLLAAHCAFRVPAQTGPGGVGNSSTNKVWLDASQLTAFSNGAKVSQWTDVSGNGFHANQNMIDNRPTFLGTMLHGKPVIHFDRTQGMQYFEIKSVGIGTVMSNSYTLITVVRATSGGLNEGAEIQQSVFMAPDYLVGTKFYGYPNVSSLSHVQVVQSPSGYPYLFNYEIANAGSWLLCNQVATKSTIGTSLKGYYSGASPASQAFNNGQADTYGVTSTSQQMVNMPDLIRIGAARVAGDYRWPLNGDIAEIILYNTNLNDAQRIIVDNYLSAKYNLSIANKYYSDNSNFNQDVQGIGTKDGIAKHSQAANSKGLILTEANGSLDAANEFVFAGHNTATNSLVNTALNSFTGERWQRSWYVQKSGTLDARLSFDWSQAGLTPTNLAAELSQYYLLYRPDLQSSFRLISSGNTPLVPVLGNTDQLTFTLDNATLQNGYYTLGKLGSFVWTGAVSSEWNTAGNWSGKVVPSSSSNVIVPFCSTCPVLSASVQVNSLLVEEGQLTLQNFTLLTAAASKFITSRISSSGGTIQAADFGEVKSCTVEGNLLLRKTGNANNAWFGNNTYRGKLTIVNQGTGTIAPATQATDTVSK